MLGDNGSVRGFFVADDGVGIPEENRDTIMEDGYTTSEDGTGLGLSIISDIVKRHDWRMEVTESETGGARFEIEHEKPGIGTTVEPENPISRVWSVRDTMRIT